MLVRTFTNYPQQVMWHMVPLLKSSYRVRSSRALDILEQVKSKCPQHTKLIEDGLQLSEKLLKLCDEKSSGDKAGTVSLNQLMPSLAKLINNSDLYYFDYPEAFCYKNHLLSEVLSMAKTIQGFSELPEYVINKFRSLTPGNRVKINILTHPFELKTKELMKK